MAAGLGFKDFTTGEVLTAADVDGYLMQGIWVFANATARDAAVTSPQEGNACYLKDTDVIQVYTGSTWAAQSASNPISGNIVDAKGDIIAATAADTVSRLAVGSNNTVLTADSSTATGLKWATPSSGGQTLLSTTSLTGSSVTISSIDQNYKHLQIVIISAYSSADALCNMRINSITSATYKWLQIAGIMATGTGQYGTNADTEMEIGRLGNSNAYNVAMHAEIFIPRYAEAEFTKIYFNSQSYESSYYWTINGTGVQSTAQALSSITLFPSTGTFSGGTVYIYGVK